MFLVGVAGGSGSGKTTFAHKIIKRLSHTEAAILHQDAYYLPAPPEHLKVHGSPNFDHPDAFDWELFREHMRRLRLGESIEYPIYDFKVSRRTDQTIAVGPCKVVVIEGIFSLYDDEIRNLFDLRIYLSVDADIRFIRRLHRDVRERGRSLDSIIRQYYETVRPMHREYLEPTQQFADLIVGEETDIAAEVVSARIKEAAL